jgi:predicted nucleic acid-binding protein
VSAAYLVDTSALVRIHRNPEVGAAWRLKATEGLLGICPVTELEVLFSARSLADRTRLLRQLREVYEQIRVPETAFDRATEVQHALTKRGQHRSAGPVDLLLAATAELSGLIVLHYDHDFETVAKLTAQPTQWVAPVGSIS